MTDVSCEKCGKTITMKESEFVYYHNRMMLVCNECAKKVNDEIKCAQKVCAAVDGRKTQAEFITRDKDAFDEFLRNIESTLKKIPNVGNLLSDIPLLVSMVKSYVNGEYTEIPYNTIIAIVAVLLYVISPLDIIPDVIPVIGFADDAMAVAFCIKMIHDDLEKYLSWRDMQSISE